MKKKSCGSCIYWIKIESIKGVCCYEDAGWATSDHICKINKWKAGKYIRQSKNKIVRFD